MDQSLHFVTAKLTQFNKTNQSVKYSQTRMTCDVQLLEHQRDAAERESASVREELREMETSSARLSESDSTVADKLQRLREHINIYYIYCSNTLPSPRCSPLINTTPNMTQIEYSHILGCWS